MRKLSLALKILSSYLLTGFLSLGFLGVYLTFTKEYPDPKELSLVSTILLWPITSFSSARQILGKTQGNIWNWFNLSTILLFLCLVGWLVKRGDLPQQEMGK